MPGPGQLEVGGSPEGGRAGMNREQREAVARELAGVIESEAFHSSRRCREFLQFIVERRLEGREDLLKERTIGVELYRRGPDYEPNSDAIVRVRATEVRKRLTQYYDHGGGSGALKIELPAGSYVPEFKWRKPGETAEPGPGAGREAPRNRRLAAWWLALAGVVLSAALFWSRPTAGALEEFWRAAMESPKPVLICLRQPVVYHLRHRVHQKYLKPEPPGHFPSPYVLPLQPGDVEVSDIVPVPDQYVTIGSARAAARFTAMFAARKKPAQIRSGSDFSFVDLKDSPAVMVGAVPHEWTEKLTGNLPFVLVQEGAVRGIREQDGERRTWWVKGLQPDGKTNEDYAIVTRMVASQTAELFVALAGVTQYGSDAASEFLTTETELSEALAKAPPGWQGKNLQFLLHLEVLGNAPGKPRVLAVRCW